ncbi:MAG: hypothetical protein KJP03_08870, partial [Gammaproteobacteria bacterium]|nr:hypothetical protein [Gammaproteobacteria bacterium]
SAVYLLCMRNCYTDEKYDDNVVERNGYVAQQDVVIVEKLHPMLTPDTNTKEFMLPADKCILLYRESMKEWENNGWKIDIDAVAASGQKVAYAIPSPGRREQKGWVLDEIPLVQLSDEEAADLAAG